MTENKWLGIDLGSTSAKAAVIDDSGQVIYSEYIYTYGNPVEAIKRLALSLMNTHSDWTYSGVCTTGSGRILALKMLRADLFKTEISCQAVGALQMLPSVKFVAEIGGQDCKGLEFDGRGMLVRYKMNTACGAGTGQTLENRATQWGMTVEEFAKLSLNFTKPVKIAGRCGVFAESDVISALAAGRTKEDVGFGLHLAVAGGYLSNTVKGLKVESPVLFLGGVAANPAMKLALKQVLTEYLEESTGETAEINIIVPQFFKVTGAIGAANHAKREIARRGAQTRFKGFEHLDCEFEYQLGNCNNCINKCDITTIFANSIPLARLGNSCEKGDIS